MNKMKRNINHIIAAMGMALGVLSLSSCIEETYPKNEAVPGQISSSSKSLEYLANSLPSFLTTWNTYGGSYYTQDWGYPCQMYMRDLLCEDFPMSDNGYNYWSYTEDGSTLRYAYYYPFYYYYAFIKNANNVISTAKSSVEGGNKSAAPYMGQGYGYRAMLYLDLYRLYEYRKTGVATLDDAAEKAGVYGLTVPIVKETTSKTELGNNPSAPFYTMYRFIMNDLNLAEEALGYYSRSNKAFMDKSVIYGLKTRLWLAMASRFEQSADDLAKQIEADKNEDGYGKLGITSANDCFAKAAEYAQKAIHADTYKPLTEAEWSDTNTGFNTANDSWMFGTLVNSKEQINTSAWYTFWGWMCSEAAWSMTQYNSYRCISKVLYDKISVKDWRRQSWVNPDDAGEKINAAGKDSVPAGYKTKMTGEEWAKLPKYANIKFRAGSGGITKNDLEIGQIASLPLMRVEEMYFDYFEAIAHTQGVAAAAQALQDFVNTYRYTDGSYQCKAKTMDDFITALMVQRRIELWGEGLVFFDYKRLNLPIKRHYTGSNYEAKYQLNSYAGYVAPWMNYMIPEDEKDRNPAVVLGPNPSGAITAE